MKTDLYREIRRVLTIITISLICINTLAAEPQLSDKLAGAIAAVDEGKVAPQHSLIVYQHGEIHLEHYWDGFDQKINEDRSRLRKFDADELHDLRSCTKSVVGLLVGIATRDGLLPDVDASASTLFDHLRNEIPTLSDDAHRAITIRQLLDMTAPFRWDQDNAKPMFARNEFWLWQAKDPAAYVWAQPVVSPPPGFNYNSGTTTLLAVAIEKRAGMDIEEYARNKLFEPMGINHWEWVPQRNGSPCAFGGLRLTPRDMLKLGQLVLQRGQWQGEQLVPEAWIDATADRRDGQRAYGYQWWLDSYRVSDNPVHAVAAGGLGGQYIHVFPDLDAVVVSTAGHYSDDQAAGEGFTLVERWILPILLDQAAP